MKYYFTADTHFGHESILKYCNRPFKGVNDMDDKMIKNWNNIVKPEDTVFHLGDFVFRGKPSSLKHSLNGKIILIKGNHDHNHQTVITEMVINHGGRDWTLIHDPAMTVANSVLCGHIHEYWKTKKIKDRIMVNVGVDVWNFKPIDIDQILKEIQR